MQTEGALSRTCAPTKLFRGVPPAFTDWRGLGTEPRFTG
jgi:hypothetical protein